MAEPQSAPQVEESEQSAPAEGPFPLSTLRHSVAHLMASAVGKLYPGVKYGFGPAITHGFYYDFELPEPLEEKHLTRIENEMRRIAKRSPEIRGETLSREEAKRRLIEAGQDYKVEALDLIPEDEEITFYGHGDWSDLCEGPHVDRLDRPFYFKLLSVAGSYWRGDENSASTGPRSGARRTSTDISPGSRRSSGATTGGSAPSSTCSAPTPRRGPASCSGTRTSASCGARSRISGGRCTPRTATSRSTRRTCCARTCSGCPGTCRTTRT